MAKVSRDEAVAALAETIRETLEAGEAVHVPELGTFRVIFRPSAPEDQPDGSVVMRPPRNEIVFDPDT